MLSSVLAEFSASGFGSVSATSNYEVVAEVELDNFIQTCLRVLRWMEAAVPYSGSHDSVICMVCSIQGIARLPAATASTCMSGLPARNTTLFFFESVVTDNGKALPFKPGFNDVDDEHENV